MSNKNPLDGVYLYAAPPVNEPYEPQSPTTVPSDSILLSPQLDPETMRKIIREELDRILLEDLLARIRRLEDKVFEK